jgi:aldose 1-epimerase
LVQLHSGANGWNSKLMSSSERSGEDAQGKYVGVAMKFHSPDGEDGFPGALDVTTTFRLYADNTLHMDFRAAHPAGSTKPTIVSMCNHAYWNLNGSDGRVGVVDQLLRVKADAITELDGKETMLSTGRIVPVKDGPYDFTSERTIGGQQMEALDKILPAPGGYDVNYVLNKDYQEDSEHPEDTVRSVLASDGTTELRAPFAARLRDPSSGRVMDVYTSAPGIQVYSGNFLDGASLVGRQNVAYPKHAAVCLETQTFPGAITHAEAWRNYPSPVLRPGQVYNHVVQHRFSIAK